MYLETPCRVTFTGNLVSQTLIASELALVLRVVEVVEVCLKP